MRIQCTSCKATAKIPAEKEGAKVRCPSCGHIYVARPAGSRGSSRSKSNDTKLMIFGGVGLVGVFFIMMVASGGDEVETSTTDTLPELVEEVVLEDLTGWDSPLVKQTRSIHRAAFERDKVKILRALAMDHVYARVKTTEEREVIPGDWGVLSSDDQFTFEEELLNGMLAYEPANLVAGWKPFDGKILLEEDALATVRITLEPRDTELGVQTRHMDWRFTKVKGAWKAWSWERWISPAEKRGELVARITPVAREEMKPASFVERGDLVEVALRAVVANLPRRIAEREVAVASEALGLGEGDAEIVSFEGHGPGNAVWVAVTHTRMSEVFSAIGEKRKPAERVAEEVAREVSAYLASGAPVGEHLADQLLIPMAFAGGGEMVCMTPSLHTRTQAEIIEKFLEVEYTFEELGPGRWRV
ncbi:MAG: zinc-ribbon domain-containing protein, partial [Planctomycetes bacterium]|nr:zinc-ribbon domain-containing protein [Planctomycetota bacterium]